MQIRWMGKLTTTSGDTRSTLTKFQAKLTLKKKNEMADYFAHFHEKFILKKSIFLKFKVQNVVCAHEFFWLAKQVMDD